MLAVLAAEEGRFLIGLADTRTDFNTHPCLSCPNSLSHRHSTPFLPGQRYAPFFLLLLLFPSSPTPERNLFSFSVWGPNEIDGDTAAYGKRRIFFGDCIYAFRARSTRRGVENVFYFLRTTRRRLTNLITRAEQWTTGVCKTGSMTASRPT